MGKYTMLIDVTKCIGCYSCRVACQMENDLPPEQSYITFTEVEKGSFPNVEWLMNRYSCMHCVDAICEKVCPKNAISYSDTGAVVIDKEECIGCKYCMKNCQFQVINVEPIKNQAGEENLRANKCTFCNGRVLEGLEPVCVSSCLTGAICFGEREEILQLAETRLKEVTGRYPEATIYHPQGVGGTHTIYLLAHDPSEYQLNSSPIVPLSAYLWKDYAQPLGKAILGFTTMAVIGGAISNKLFNKEASHHGGGEEDESN